MSISDSYARSRSSCQRWITTLGSEQGYNVKGYHDFIVSNMSMSNLLREDRTIFDCIFLGDKGDNILTSCFERLYVAKLIQLVME